MSEARKLAEGIATSDYPVSREKQERLAKMLLLALDALEFAKENIGHIHRCTKQEFSICEAGCEAAAAIDKASANIEAIAKGNL